MFYKDNVPHSPYFDLLNPILEKINLKSLVRIKANNSLGGLEESKTDR